MKEGYNFRYGVSTLVSCACKNRGYQEQILVYITGTFRQNFLHVYNIEECN